MIPDNPNRPIGADNLPTSSQIAPAKLNNLNANTEQFDQWLDQHSATLSNDPNRIYNPEDPGRNGIRINVSKFVLATIAVIFLLSVGSIGAYAIYNAVKGPAKTNGGGGTANVQASLLLDTSGRNLHINYDTTIANGKNLTASGEVLIQNQSAEGFKIQNSAGSNIMVADTDKSQITIGAKPPGQVALSVNGDITVNGELVSTSQGYSLSNQGLTIGGVLVCTANGCVSSNSPPPTPSSPSIDVANLMYLNTNQTISGTKTFSAATTFNANVTINAPLQVAGNVNTTAGFSVGGVSGGSFSCAANELLQQAVISGGIITSGTCVTIAGGTTPTLQDVYDASAPANLILSNASGVFDIQDASSPLATNLFQVGSNGNATLYFAVNNLGISVTGNVNTTGQYRVGGIQISSANLSNDANLAKVNGNTTFTGNNTFSSASNSFTGNGSGLTSLNASNISSGTLNDARLSNNVALLNALQTFTGQNTFSNASNSFTGNGGGLTSLNASNISSGTLNDLRLSGNVTVQGNTFNGASQLVQLTAGGILPVLNGSNLTALNASNISSGTLNDTRLSSNVALLSANNIFLGNDSFHLNSTALSVQDAASPLGTDLFQVTDNAGTTKYFEVSATGAKVNGNAVCTAAGNCVGTGGGGAIGGSGTAGKLAVFTGSGFTIGDSLLSQSGGTVTVNGNINLASGNTYQINGSQISSANLSNDSNLAKLNGTQTFTGANTFSNASNSFTGDGSGLSNVNAAQLNGQNGNYYTNASNLSSGTLNDARLSSNVALKNGNNTFTGNNVFSLNTAGLSVQDASSPLGTNLFQVTDNAGTTKYFTVSATALQFNGNDVCTTSGNCTGVTGIGGSGTAGKIAKFTGTGNSIGDSLISDNGSTVTIGGVLAVNTITPTSTLTVGTASQTLTLQGDGSSSLSATVSGIKNSLVFATPTISNKTITLPDASGTVAVSASGPLSLDAAGNLTCPTCLTTGGGGGTTGVTSVNSLTGAITLAGTANQVIITPASNTLTFSLPQDISTTSTPDFAGIDIGGSAIASSNLSDSANLAKLNGTQTFTGANTFSNASNSFTGDGSGLTNLNATNIASGTLSDSRLTSNVALLNRTGQIFTGDNTIKVNSANAFQVQNANGEAVLGIDTTNTNLVTNSNFESGTSGWAAIGSAVISSNSSRWLYGENSLQFVSNIGGTDGIKYQVSLASSTTYTFSFYALATSGTNENISFGRSENGIANTQCAFTVPGAAIGNYWRRYNCTFTTSTTSGSTYVYIIPQAGVTFLVDGVLLQTGAILNPYSTGKITGAGVFTGPIVIQGSEGIGASAASLLQIVGSDGSVAFSVDNSSSAGSNITTNMITLGGTNPVVNATITLPTNGVLSYNAGNHLFGTAAAAPSLARLDITPNSISQVGENIRAASGQSANLFQLQDSSNNIQSGFDATGQLFLGRASGLTGGLTLYNSGGSGKISISAANPGSSNYTITVPAETGTICTTAASSACNTSGGLSNVAYLNANQTFTGNNTFSSASNSFTGDGSGLTNLNATNVASGTLSDSRLSANVALLNATQTFTGNGNKFQNASNSATAFQIQDNSGASNLFVADTTTNRIAIGQSSSSYTLGVNGSINGSTVYQNGNQVCDTSGNCVGTGGGGSIGGGGTAGKIALFTGSGFTIGDSVLSQASGNITVNGNLNVAAGFSINVAGGNTGSRPGSPSAGQIYYDTTTNQLLQYNGSKWVSDHSTATKIVAASNSSQAQKDAADYVATGTGDQATINSALSALPAGGGTVYLLSGTYKLSGTVSVPDNTTLAGDGASSIITIPNSQNGSYNFIQNSDTTTGTNVTIQNLLIDGNKANQTGGTTFGIYLNGMGGGSGASARIGGKITNVTVQNIFGAHGIVLNNSSNNALLGNTSLGNGSIGFLIQSNSANNLIEGNNAQGNGTGFLLDTSSRNTLTGNTVQGNGNGITLSTSSNDTVTGNNVQGNFGFGIYLSSSANSNTISGNKVYDTGGNTDNNGIYLELTSVSNTITGNDITDSSCTNTCYAINISDAGSTKNYLSNNRFSGDATHPASINNLATNTILSNQQTNVTTSANNDVTDFVTRGSANSTTAFQVQNSSGTSLLNVDSTNARIGVDVTYTTVTTPSGLSAGVPTNGGTLTLSTTYFYEVTAIDSAGGETLPSTESSRAIASSGTNRQIPLTWTAVTGASGYKIYRSTSTGTEVYLTTVLTNSYTDTNSISPGSATPPGSTTAYISTNNSNNSLQLSIGGIGTPTGQLYVSGIIPRDVSSGGVATGSQPYDVFIVGHFAYVVTWSGSKLQVLDISNPVRPVDVSSGGVATGSNPSSVYVQGHYAYVTVNGTNKLRIFDISKPSSPVDVTSGGVTTNSNPQSVYVEGRYAYVADNGASKLQVFDVSNPASPVEISGGITTSSGPQSVYAQGRLVYLVDSGSSRLQIFDASNPNSLTELTGGGVATASTPNSISVSGRYAYVLSSSKLQVFDVSNPASPVDVSAGGATTANNAKDIYVQGRYAYVTAFNANKLQVFDVSNPASPVDVSAGGATTSGTVQSVFVQGRYAYVTVYGVGVLQVFDVGGAYIQQLEAGGAEFGTLSVDSNANFAGDSSIAGGLQLGQSLQVSGNVTTAGGLNVQGSTVINGGLNSISTPGTPTVTPQGTTGAQRWDYTITAVNAYGGETVASSAGTTATGNATLGAVNFNRVTWSAVSGATSYKIYRTFATGGTPSTTGLIGSTSALTFDDTGLAAAGSAPTVNTTGQLTVTGSALFQNSSNSTAAFQIQNAAGTTTLLNADTSVGKLTFGVNVAASADIDATGSVATKKGADYTATGTQADVNFGDASLIRLNPASPLTIAGIANGRDGYQLRLVNASAVTVTINDNDTTNELTAANRIITGVGGNINILAGAGLEMIYDSGSSVWRVVGSGTAVAGGGSTLSTAYTAGSSSADQTLNLTNSDGGGVILKDNSTPITGSLFSVQNSSSGKFLDVSSSKITVGENTVGNAASTATTATTSGTGTNTTTVTLTAVNSLANGDVIFIDNAGQDYFTRITAGGGTTSLTVDPAVTFENARTVTKYNVQYLGSDGTNFSGATRNQNSFYQGYFLGGVVTGAGSTVYSDANIKSSNNLQISTATGVKVKNTADSTSAFQIQNAAGTAFFTADSTNRYIGINNSSPNAALDVVASTSSFFDGFESGTLTPFTATGGMAVSTNNPHTGTYSASDLVDWTGTLSLVQTLSAPGNISFWMNVGCGAEFDVDGVSSIGSPSQGAYTQFTVGVSAGTHTFTWKALQGPCAVSHTWYMDDVTVTNVSSVNAATFTGGNVGIGTAFPTASLEVDGTGLFKSVTNSSSAFQIQNASGSTALGVDTGTNTNIISNGSLETGTTGWAGLGSATLVQSTAQKYVGTGSLNVGTTALANDGAKYALTTATLASNTKYTLTLAARLPIGQSMSTLEIGRAEDGSTFTSCLTGQTLSSSGWTTFNCTFTTGTTSGTPFIYVRQTDATARNIYIDAVQLTRFSMLTNASIEQAIAGNWAVKGSSAVTQDATQFSDGTKSLKVVTTAANNDGAKQAITLNDGTFYTVSFQALNTGVAFATMEAGYSSDGTNDDTPCMTAQTVTGSWTNFTCTFTTPGFHSGTPYFYIKQTNNVVHTFYVDAVQLVQGNPVSAYREGIISLNNVINSPAVFQNQANSTTAFQIQNATGTNLFNIDTLTSSIALGANTTVGAGLSLTITGGNTASRPASPTEGMLYYDTTTKSLLVYSNGKWQADRSSSTKIVSMGAPAGCSGTSPVASLNYDNADYVVNSCTSAQTTINSAITALGAQGGTVYLEEGTYIIDGTINLASNVTLVGSGPSTTLKLKDSINAGISAVTASSITRIGVRDLKLDGNRTNNSSGTQHGLSLTGIGSGTGTSAVPGITANNITIQNFRSNGIDTNGITNSTISNSSIINVGGHGIAFGFTGGGANATYLRFNNNTIQGSGGHGVYGDINSNPSYSEFNNNVIDSNTSNGFYISGSYNTFSGNTIKSNGVHGMDIEGVGNVITGNSIVSNTGAGVIGRGSHNTISSNTIASNTAGGISLDDLNSGYNTVTGNKVVSNGSTGIYLGGGTGNTATGNTVSNNSGNGIDTKGGYGTISGNAVASNTSVGIHVSCCSSNNNIISGNNVSSNSGSGIVVDASDGTRISDNKLYDNGGSGANSSILIFANAFHTPNANQVIGNTISDTAGTAYAIELSGGLKPTNTYISTNIYSGTGATSILDTGTTGTTYVSQANSSGDIVLNNQGSGLTIGAMTASATLSLQGALKSVALTTVSQPTVTPQGTTGSATWSYKITALDGLGETAASTAGSTASGNATLTSSNYNAISWSAVGGAIQYKIYRTTSGGTPATTGLIGTVSANTLTFNDTGIAATTAAPSTNTSGGLNIQGNAMFKPTTDSTTALQVQNAAGTTNLLTIDTSGLIVQTGSATTDATAVLNVLDSYNNGTDPTGVNGAMYYNTSLNQFRCYTNGTWAACNASSGTLQNAYDNSTSPATITTSSSAKGIVIAAGSGNDSTSLFKVQNAAGAGLLNIDSVNSNLSIGLLSGGTLSSWTTNGTSLPLLRFTQASVTANGYIYAIGGNDNTTQVATVYYAKQNSDGSVGSWTTNANALPAARDWPGAVVANGYLYVVGGRNGVTAQNNVYYAKLNSDGSTGTWTTSTVTLPQALFGEGVVTANNYLYVFGGYNGGSQSTVYSAKLNQDGSIGAWATSTNTLPAARYDLSAVYSNGYAYVLGGSTGADVPQSTVYYAKLNIDGSVGTWTTSANALPDIRNNTSAVVSNNRIYVIGGSNNALNGVQSTVYYATLNADGSNSSWTTNTNTLPQALRSQSSVILNGYVYSMGGYNGTSVLTTVYYSTLSGLTRNLGQQNINDQLSVGNGLSVLGSASTQALIDSTSIFSVQNSAGSSLLNIDSTNNAISLLGNTNGQLGAWATNPTALPTAQSAATSVVANGYVYEIGGTFNDSGGYFNTVYYAKINGDGTIGSWTTSTKTLPNVRGLATSVYANGYIYVIGGWQGSCCGSQTTVYYTKVNSDGSIGAWQTASSLPDKRHLAAAVYSNGYIYEIGGDNATGSTPQTTVYYAKANPDGTLGPWQTNANPLPLAREGESAAVANGYVYVIGGYSANTTVYYAKLNADGSTGAWTTSTNPLPVGLNFQSSVVSNGYLYAVGGANTGSNSTVYYTKLNNDGSTGNWTLNTNLFTSSEKYFGQVVTYNGYIYNLGGNSGYFGTSLSTIYYASTSRIQIGANLDLVGLQSSTESDSGDSPNGSVGGSITAGNITAVGSLQVQGAASFSQSISVNGNLSVSGSSITLGPTANGDISSWQTGTSTSLGNRQGTATVTANGYIYVIGGHDGSTYQSNVYYSKLNADGTNGSWSSANSLPAAEEYGSAVYANGYLYELGGFNGGSMSNVYYAKVNSDGSLGSWSTSSATFPHVGGLYQHTSIVANGYIYIIGGYSSSGSNQNPVYYAKLNADGSVGAWSTNANNLTNAVNGGSAVTANGYVYVVGGSTTGFDAGNVNTLQYAKLNADGSTGTWSTNTLPVNNAQEMTAVANGYLYMIGGRNTSSVQQSTVYYSKLGASGTPGTWAQSGYSLPVAKNYTTAVAANGYIYVSAGQNNSGTAVNTVYYTSTARVQVAGSLDLVGVQGLTLSDGGDGSTGSAGGSITAGNITAVGSLQVQGAATFSQAMNVNGNLSVAGQSIALGSTNSGELQSWNTANSLPGTTYINTVTNLNGYIYSFGGNGSSSSYYAKLNANGSTSTWSSTTSLPGTRAYASSAAANGYVYVVGGFDGSVCQTTTLYARPSTDGTISGWSSDPNPLPAGICGHGTVVANGYLYALAGSPDASSAVSTIYYAKLNADGTTGAWQTNSYALGCTTPGCGSPAARAFVSSVVANGYVYVLGGYNGSAIQSSVYYAKLNADGSTGAWTTSSNALPQILDFFSSVVMNGYVYVIGGNNGTPSLNTYYYAKLNGDGSTSTWSTGVSKLPSTRYTHASTVANGYVYVVAGQPTSGSPQSTVYYASTSRVLVGGSLDLVGLQGQTLADAGDSSSGSTGGSITAGSITAVGALQVQGQGTFVNGISVGGSITIGGSALFKNASNSTTAFSVQDTSGVSLLGVDTSSRIITLAGDSTTFANITFSNAHVKSIQTTAPTIGTPVSCGTSPSAAITSGSTDSAGSITITAGTGSPTNCETTITFNKSYGAAPKAIVVSPTAAVGSVTAAKTAQVKSVSSTSFSISVIGTSPAAGDVMSFYYWVVE